MSDTPTKQDIIDDLQMHVDRQPARCLDIFPSDQPDGIIIAAGWHLMWPDFKVHISISEYTSTAEAIDYLRHAIDWLERSEQPADQIYMHDGFDREPQENTTGNVLQFPDFGGDGQDEIPFDAFEQDTDDIIPF